MRMKFNRLSQLVLVAALNSSARSVASSRSLAASSLNPKSMSQISPRRVQTSSLPSGRMRQIITSPFPSGGRNPVAEAVSPDQADLYVVNEDDNSIVQFVIGSDGKLYPQNTVNTPGIFPIATSVSGSFLYLLDTRDLSLFSPF